MLFDGSVEIVIEPGMHFVDDKRESEHKRLLTTALRNPFESEALPVSVTVAEPLEFSVAVDRVRPVVDTFEIETELN